MSEHICFACKDFSECRYWLGVWLCWECLRTYWVHVTKEAMA